MQKRASGHLLLQMLVIATILIIVGIVSFARRSNERAAKDFPSRFPEIKDVPRSSTACIDDKKAIDKRIQELRMTLGEADLSDSGDRGKVLKELKAAAWDANTLCDTVNGHIDTEDDD